MSPLKEIHSESRMSCTKVMYLTVLHEIFIYIKTLLSAFLQFKNLKNSKIRHSIFEKVQIYKMCIFCHENSTPTLYTWKKNTNRIYYKFM